MIGFMAFVSAAADGFAIYRYHRSLLAITGKPVIQTFRKRFGVQLLEHSPKRIAVWYPVWKLQKLAWYLPPLYAELLHIGKIVSIAYQGTQS